MLLKKKHEDYMKNNYSFTVMNKNLPLVKVSVHDGNVETVMLNMVKGITPFGYSNVTVSNVEDYIKSRCFSKNRPDASKILEKLSIHEYNPVKITKKTHGRMHGDNIWLDYSGDTKWEDVREEL